MRNTRRKAYRTKRHKLWNAGDGSGIVLRREKEKSMANANVKALMCYIIKQKQQHFIKALHEHRTNLFPDISKDGNVKMTEHRIYIGLNDTETREQQFETERYLEQLKEVCRGYKAAFSVDIEEGGYYHEDGDYTEETSLVLVLIDTDRDKVQNIAKDLCTLFHQESVLVTEDVIDGRFIR